MATNSDNCSAQNILNELLEGNARYVAGNSTQFSPAEQKLKSGSPQKPKAVIVSCIDSRVPIELVFDQGVGDLFVARIAGNVSNDDIVGSLEFATVLSGVELIVVLGHTSCGAVQGACKQAEHGKLTQLLDKIKPAVKSASQSFEGEPNAENMEFVNYVAAQNAQNTVEALRSASPSMADLESNNKLKLVPAMYDLSTQEVSLLD